MSAFLGPTGQPHELLSSLWFGGMRCPPMWFLFGTAHIPVWQQKSWLFQHMGKALSFFFAESQFAAFGTPLLCSSHLRLEIHCQSHRRWTAETQILLKSFSAASASAGRIHGDPNCSSPPKLILPHKDLFTYNVLSFGNKRLSPMYFKGKWTASYSYSWSKATRKADQNQNREEMVIRLSKRSISGNSEHLSWTPRNMSSEIWNPLSLCELGVIRSVHEASLIAFLTRQNKAIMKWYEILIIDVASLC